MSNTNPDFNSLPEQVADIRKDVRELIDLFKKHAANPAVEPPHRISIEEICKKYHLKKQTIYGYNCRGLWSSYKIGRRIYYDPIEIEQFFLSKRRKSFNEKFSK